MRGSKETHPPYHTHVYPPSTLYRVLLTLSTLRTLLGLRRILSLYSLLEGSRPGAEGVLAHYANGEKRTALKGAR